MANNLPYINHFQYSYYNNGLNYNNYQQYYPNYNNYHVNYSTNANFSSTNYATSNNFPWANNYSKINKSNNKYKKNVNYTSKTFDCGVCNLFFKNNRQLEEHINDTHIKCNFEDCNFNGPLEILEIHKLRHIKNENGESLIDSKEETIKWINSRKSKFPKSNSSDSSVKTCKNTSIQTELVSKSRLPTSNGNNRLNMSDIDLNTHNEVSNTHDPKIKNKQENGNKNEQSMLEMYLRNNMNNKTTTKRLTKSIICPILNKIYKQPSALIRYTNPFKYENLLKRMDSLNSPYSFKSSIIEKLAPNSARLKNTTPSKESANTDELKGSNKVKKTHNKKYVIYSIPKRPPAYLELIRSDVERLDSLVVETIKTIQYLKSNEKCVNIKRYSGCVAAVDAMCWIHRSMVSSAVANVRGEISDKFLKFIISMLSLLLSYNITPIMVFDGYEMPAKKAENAMRRERREKAKKEALEMIAKNKNKINTEIMKKCMQAIHITPEIIYRVISVCKKINVAVIVSPFEADAQISYLCRSGIADLAISEDSDLVVYGCPKIIYKLDKEGRGVELNVPFNSSKLLSAPRGRRGVKSENQETKNVDVSSTEKNTNVNSSCKEETKSADSKSDGLNSTSGDDKKDPKSEGNENKEEEVTPSNKSGDIGDNRLENKVKDGIFKGLNHRMFVVMCVLSGTDYDEGYHINGMGLKIAYRLILEHEHLSRVLKSVYDDAKWSNKLSEYKFEQMLLHYENVCKIFLHNIVFDPKKHQLVHINPITNLDNMSTSKLELLKQEAEEYKLIYDMSSFLINKNVNFINVAKGLISVADDMEIDYVLTEYDLTVIESITNNISFDLYRLPSTRSRLPSFTAGATNRSPTSKSSTRSPSVKSVTGSPVRSDSSRKSKGSAKRQSSASSTKPPKRSSRSDKSAARSLSKSSSKANDQATDSGKDKASNKQSSGDTVKTGTKPTSSDTGKTVNKSRGKQKDSSTSAFKTSARSDGSKQVVSGTESRSVKAESTTKNVQTVDKRLYEADEKLKLLTEDSLEAKAKLMSEFKRDLNSGKLVKNLLTSTETYKVKRKKK